MTTVGPLDDDLRMALAHDALDLVFQPEFDLLTGKVVAVEALARWTHPQLGEIEPEAFVAAAERTGLIGELGDWALRLALTHFAAWTEGLPELSVTLRVNVSITQMLAPDFAAGFGAVLEQFGVHPSRLCLEITESAPRQSPSAVRDCVRALRALGTSVAIDDLANGYSTLGMLRAVPADVIKADRSLVSGVDDDPKAATIIGALVALATKLSLTLVVEGIETEGERDTLRDLGCRHAQGFLLSPPLSPSEAREALVTRGARRPRPT